MYIYIIYIYIYIYIYKWLKNKANKERLQKKACERYQNLSKEKKNEKNDNMVLNLGKTSQKIKNKRLFSIEKKYYRMRKKAFV